MVERNVLFRASFLDQQYRAYQAALHVLAHDPKMVSFTLSEAPDPDDPESAPAPVTVSAEGIETPPQMLTAIQQQIQARLKVLDEELSGLGVAAAPPFQAPQRRAAAPPPQNEPQTPPEPAKPASEAPKPASRSATTPTHRGRR